MVGINLIIIFQVVVLALLSLVPSQAVGYQASIEQVEVREVTNVKKKTVKEMVEDEFGVGHIMVEVARCESGWRQFKEDGSVLMSHYGTDDAGVFQINKVHLPELKLLNLDRNKTLDNIAFARVLYDRNGLRDWEASRVTCWGK